MDIDERTVLAIKAGVRAGGNVVFVTGAGISAESGIRPYRGEDGLWTEGGADAMDKSTLAYFSRDQVRSGAAVLSSGGGEALMPAMTIRQIDMSQEAASYYPSWRIQAEGHR